MSGNPDILIGDIGGTNARFALSGRDKPGYTQPRSIAGADYPTVEAAIAAYLRSGGHSIDGICLAIAAPVTSDEVRLTNGHWTISTESLAEKFAAKRVTLLNDFEAIAWAIPSLEENDCVRLGDPDNKPGEKNDMTVAIVGPGTGLGTGVLLKRNGAYYAQATEGGRVGFSPDSSLQIEVANHLLNEFERVAAERILSGPGVENLDRALSTINGYSYVQRSSAEIFNAALANDDDSASETVGHFFEILGQYAGDYVLAVGAFDGLYIAGGIVPRYPKLLRNSQFRKGFENKGKYRALMESVPVRLIAHEQPGLLGASARALQNR